MVSFARGVVSSVRTLVTSGNALTYFAIFLGLRVAHFPRSSYAINS
jgi:hypothetical protein